MTPRVDIICLVHNGLSITKGFVKALFENTSNFRLIFVDNGSTDGTPDFLKEGEKLNIENLYDDLHSELGWEIDNDKRPANTVIGLIKHLKNIVSANSRPKFASEITESFNTYVKNGGEAKVFLDTMFAAPAYENLKT